MSGNYLGRFAEMKGDREEERKPRRQTEKRPNTVVMKESRLQDIPKRTMTEKGNRQHTEQTTKYEKLYRKYANGVKRERNKRHLSEKSTQ